MIADSFNVRFAPLSLDLPRALMPLANVPLIDYTIDFLVSCGVEEIVLFCCTFAQEIQQHVSQSGLMPHNYRRVLVVMQRFSQCM